MSDLKTVYAELKAILAPYGARMAVKKDSDVEYYVETSDPALGKEAAFFGAVHVKKSFVSFHLMPVYTNPELLEGVSTDLKARMQGKSCFNFKAVDDRLFKELAALTKRGYRTLEAQGRAQ